MNKEVYAIIYDFRLADYHENKVDRVFVKKIEAVEFLFRMERVMREEYDWRNHRATYESIVRGDNYVRGTYGTMSCEYRIERANLIY